MSDEGAPRDPAALPKVLAAIAQTLESLDGSAARLLRVLELAHLVVPFDQAALLLIPRREGGDLVFYPEPSGDDRAELDARLEALAGLLLEDARAPLGDEVVAARPGRSHVAIPLVGLEQLVGVLYTERRAEAAYDEAAVATLALVATELGAYLTLGRLVEEQARAARELSRAHEFQQLLIGIVSHDLRNPLSVIGATAALQLRRGPDAQLRKELDRIVSSAGRANDIIRDLLDATQTRAGQGIPVEPTAMDLDALARSAVEDVQVAAPTRIVVYVGPGATCGRGDPERLRQVVNNLLGNALRHGAAEREVTVRLAVDGAEARLSVHNGGLPIPLEAQLHIFDPFRRGPPANAMRAPQGLGLGLYIVREIVERHGGRVELESTEANGTTFTVVLPRFVGAPESDEPAAKPG